jgi:hypothetical protein
MPETCRILEIKAKIIHLHLVGYIYTFCNAMHGTMNLKFIGPLLSDIWKTVGQNNIARNVKGSVLAFSWRGKKNTTESFS